MHRRLLMGLCALALTWGSITLLPSVTREAQAGMPADLVTRSSAKAPVTLNYPKRFAPAAKTLEQRARVSTSKLQYRLGLETFPHVDVWLLSDLDHFYEWHERDILAPKWAVGLSLVDRQTVLVRHGLGPDRQIVDIDKTFDHELAHVAIDAARQGHHVPRWFNEGFASWAAGEWTLERSELVARSAATGQLIPLADLDRTFPSHQSMTGIAYAEATHFVRLMADRYGEEVFGKILEKIRVGETFSVSFSMITGDDFEHVERTWRQGLAANSDPLSGFADGSGLFFGASLLFLVAWAKRRRRSREKFEHLDDYVEGWDYDPARYRLPGLTHTT